LAKRKSAAQPAAAGETHHSKHYLAGVAARDAAKNVEEHDLREQARADFMRGWFDRDAALSEQGE
jgi:hypothetical protein